jgi:hypothetical protein
MEVSDMTRDEFLALGYMTQEEFDALPYEQQRQLLDQRGQANEMRGQQNQGISPGQAYNAYQKYAGGGAGAAGASQFGPAAGMPTMAAELASGGGSAAAGTGGAVQAVGAAELAGGGAGAASGAGSGGATAGLAAAWPVAAIAAGVLMENKQNKDGNRASGSKAEYVGDMVSGKVLERDAERYLGKDASKLIRSGTPSGIVRNTKDAFKDPKKLFPWEWF